MSKASCRRCWGFSGKIMQWVAFNKLLYTFCIVSLMPLNAKTKPVVASIHLLFFSPPVYKWLTHHSVILRGVQSNNGVNQPKQPCPALKEQTMHIQKHLQKSKMPALLNVRATGKGACLVIKGWWYSLVRILVFLLCVNCKLLRRLAGSRYFQVHLNIWKVGIVTVKSDQMQKLSYSAAVEDNEDRTLINQCWW